MFLFWIKNQFDRTVVIDVMCFVSTAGCLILFLLYRRQVDLSFRLVKEERLRLTRDVHDTLLQGFLGVVYHLEAASRSFHSSPELSKEWLQLSLTRADQALLETRDMLSTLRFRPLAETPFPNALFSLVRGQVEGKSITPDIHIDSACLGLPYKMQVHIYMIVREAVSNAVNHGQPSRISLELRCTANGFGIIIQDNGRGFDLTSP